LERVIDELRESQLQIVALTRKQTGETYVDNKTSCAKPCFYFRTAGDGASSSSYERCFRIRSAGEARTRTLGNRTAFSATDNDTNNFMFAGRLELQPFSGNIFG
jgi:hypothetical protein